MRILVTGNTGFMGSNLVQRLKLEYPDADIRTVSRRDLFGLTPTGGFLMAVGGPRLRYSQQFKHYTLDLSDDAKVKEMMDHFQPDTIFHLAANPSGKPDQFNPCGVVDDNIKSVINLCHYSLPNTRFINASTIVVYGDSRYSGTEDGPTMPTSMYAMSKLASEGILRAYHKEGKVIPTNLRFCAVVGKGLTHGVVYDFINKLRSNTPRLELLGNSPGSVKPYIHINDAVSSFVYVYSRKLEGTYNVCNIQGVTIDKLADIVMEELNIKKPKQWLGSEANWKTDNPMLHAYDDRLKNEGFQYMFNDSESALRQAIKDISNE